jgi:hypothetical protein
VEIEITDDDGRSWTLSEAANVLPFPTPKPVAEDSASDSEPVAKHAFNAALDTTFERCGGVSNQRAGEYRDSWLPENMITTFLDHTLVAILGTDIAGRITRTEKRLLNAATMVDLKDSRMIGPWKQDTVDDGINYRGAYAEWMERYMHG